MVGREGHTIFALGDVAAFVAPLRVGGVTPGADTIPVWVPAVVQLQAVGASGSPPERNVGEGGGGLTLTPQGQRRVRRVLLSPTSHL